LLLGAGASVDAGIGAMDELFQFFGCADFDAFCQKIGQTTATERYRYLAEFLQTRKPAEVSAAVLISNSMVAGGEGQDCRKGVSQLVSGALGARRCCMKRMR
jgi:hypothetical protein